jgi:acyl-coenzyme A synthetase/AMP-(fatty) acid ligase
VSLAGEAAPARFNLVRHALAGKPAKTALIVSGAVPLRRSYGELEEEVLRLAQGFRQEGVEAGRRLFMRMGNSFDYVLVFLAAIAAGAIPVAASPELTASEAGNLAAHAGAQHLAWDGILPLPDANHARIIGPEHLAALKRSRPADYADTGADDPAFMIYTSGSSGQPKGVLHAQRVLWGRRPMYQGWYGIGPGDVVLHTGALNWSYTLGAGLLDPFVNGATAIVHVGQRDAGTWERLAREHGATILASLPGLYRQMLRASFKAPSSLRHALAAGEALAVPLLEAWRQSTGSELYEALGMSEISTYISSSPSLPVKPGSPGKPQPGRRVRLLDDGQIAVHRSDPGLFLNYWGEAPPEGEWFATGDLAAIDGDGYYWHLGRANELMNAGGFRVSPLEVEAVLATHPKVAEVACREWRVGETTTIIAAFIVPKAGLTAEESEIMGFARQRLAAYKCPRQVWFVASLPRTPSGKLIRSALAKP